MKNFKKYLPRFIVIILIIGIIVSPAFIKLPEKTNKEIAVEVFSDIIKTSLKEIIPGEFGENVSILSERAFSAGIDKASNIFKNLKNFIKNKKEIKIIEPKKIEQKKKEKNEFIQPVDSIEAAKEETYKPINERIIGNLRRIFIEQRKKEN